jgi:hypothetical protein
MAAAAHFFVFFVGAHLVANWSDWRSLLFCVFCAIACLSLNTLSINWSAISTAFHAAIHFMRFKGCDFQRISESQILNACDVQTSQGANSSMDVTPFESIFNPLTGIFGKSYAGWRYFFEPTAKDPPALPLQISTFGSTSAGWVFFNAPVAEANGFKKFILLHELHHAGITGGAMGTSAAFIRIGSILSILPLSVFVPAEHGYLYALVLGSMVVNSVAYWRRDKYETALSAEKMADHFAIMNSRPEWFSAAPPEAYAEKICQEDIGEGEDSIGVDLRAERVSLLAHRIRLFTLGEDLSWKTSDDKRPQYDKNIVTSIWKYGLFASALYLGYSAPTPGLLLSVSIAAICVVLAASFSLIFHATRQMIVPDDGQAKAGEKLRAIQPKIKQWLDGKKSMAHSTEPAPDTQGFFFQPSEFDLHFADERLWVFYGKPVALPRISKVVYHRDQHWVVVEMNDGERLDLGRRIQWQHRAKWEKAEQVTFARTDQKRIVEQRPIPLEKIGSPATARREQLMNKGVGILGRSFGVEDPRKS